MSGNQTAEQPRHPGSGPLPLRTGPRSPVWQWLLGGSSAAAYALLFGLANSFVQNSFRDSAVVRLLGGTLDFLTFLVVAGAVGYVGVRVVTGVRERRRLGRELALTADLIPPGPVVRTIEPERPSAAPARAVESEPERLMVQALRGMPVDEFDTDALLAVHAALVDAPFRLPLKEHRLPPESDPLKVLVALERAGHLLRSGTGWYRLNRSAPSSTSAGDLEREATLRTALPALLRHHADLATRWARALDTLDPKQLAPGARRWFEMDEDYLLELVMGCCQYEEPPHPSVVTEVARIVDALEVWYARISETRTAQRTGFGLGWLAARQFPVLFGLAWTRTGQLPEPSTPKGLRPRRLAASLRARWEHQYALGWLTRPGERNPAELNTIEEQLENAWWKVPREDVSGEVCALINLAVVHLRQGRLEAARDRLELALSLTRGDGNRLRDPSGRAHTFETLGIVDWTQGTPRRAIDHWYQALDIYRALEEDHGIGRCLRHLGSALVVAPEFGGLLLDENEPLSEPNVVRQATGWLHEARRLHGSHVLVDKYLERARELLGDAHAPTGLDRWPLDPRRHAEAKPANR